MKRVVYRIQVLIFVISVSAVLSYGQSQTSNSISGFIFDAVSRSPVPDLYVELLDDVYTTIKRVKVDGSGRYFFSGISSGNFKVKVLPYGTNYLEEIQDVTIINPSSGNVRISDNAYLDLYLKLDKRKANIYELGAAESLFVQDVPPAARSLFKKAITQLKNPKEAPLGLESLKKAIEISPNYYDALNGLGIEYVRRSQFEESFPFLIKAIEVNQRSFSSFFALGYAAYSLKKTTEAGEAFRAATIINPQSTHAYFQYGRVLRINGNHKEAEQALLKAKTLDKDLLMSEIYWQLALLYEKTGRYNSAANELETYLKIQSDVSNKQQIKTLITQMRAKAK